MRDEWNGLVARCPFATVFQTWEWNYAWWSTYCRSNLKGRLNAQLHLIEIREDGALTGLFPLWRSRRRKVLGFLGEHATDYLMPIGSQNACAELLAQLKTESGDRVELIDIPSDHPFLALAPAEALRESGVCPRVALPHSADELLQGISSNLRHSIRKGDRELLQSGRGQFADATAESWSAEMERFEGLYASRAAVKGLKRALTDPYRAQFWRMFCGFAAERGWLRLKLLTLDDRPACGILCFSFGGTVSYYAQGMDPEYAAHAPGNLTLWHAVQDAIAEGAGYFDFLRGPEEFKMRWRPELRNNVDVLL